MTSDRITQLAAIGTAALALIGGAALAPLVQGEREELQLAFAVDVQDEVPPDVALAVTALGSFRGLAVDYLWYRANELKEAGEFYEANQLSQWITTLQPRFPQVWAFHAWNMAYNISVATHTPTERWDWVNKGIHLLRDRGIPYNPRAVRLYRELGWIFFHKVGGMTDDMHWFYKQNLAYDWQELLGNPTEGATGQQAADNFRPIAEAPQTQAQLIAESPATGPLIAALNQRGWSLNEELLRRMGRVQMLAQSLDIAALASDPQSALASEKDQQAAEIMRDPELKPGVEPLLAYLRQQVLRENYHMDAQIMLDLMEKFGPVDWRHPAGHSLYWASRGVAVAAGLRDDEHIDVLNTDRQVIHSLQQLAWFGRLGFDPVTRRIDLLPDPRFFPAYNTALKDAQERIAANDKYFDTVHQNFESGHENFLQRAVFFSYLYGSEEQARDFFLEAKELYEHKRHNVNSSKYNMTLQDFVFSEMQLDMGNRGVTRQFIDAMIIRGLTQGLANNRLDVFHRFLTLARRAHREKQADSIVNPTATRDRMKLLPFDQTLLESYIGFMRQPSVSLLLRSRVYRNTPLGLELRQKAYDRLGPTLQQQARAAQPPVDFNRAFPEPPDMDQYRDTNSQQGQQQDPAAVERN